MKKSFYQSSLKIIKNYILRNSNTLKKENNKKKLLNEKKRKSSKIRREKERERERIPNSLQTRSTERKSSPRESPRLVAAIVALDQHKTRCLSLSSLNYRRGQAGARVLARGLSRGWNLCERSESVAGEVTITTPWEGLQFWRQFNLNRSCKRELWANVYRGNRL